jgi:hypothetical protein
VVKRLLVSASTAAMNAIQTIIVGVSSSPQTIRKGRMSIGTFPCPDIIRATTPKAPRRATASTARFATILPATRAPVETGVA